jgi:hypothetical protein
VLLWCWHKIWCRLFSLAVALLLSCQNWQWFRTQYRRVNVEVRFQYYYFCIITTQCMHVALIWYLRVIYLVVSAEKNWTWPFFKSRPQFYHLIFLFQLRLFHQSPAEQLLSGSCYTILSGPQAERPGPAALCYSKNDFSRRPRPFRINRASFVVPIDCVARFLISCFRLFHQRLHYSRVRVGHDLPWSRTPSRRVRL